MNPKPCHMVAMPYAGRGHINPMMNLCKILSSKLNNNPNLLRITFVVTDEWLGLIGSQPKPPTITIATIPNVLPSEKIRATDMRSFLTATFTKMKDPFEHLLDRLEEEAKSSGSDGGGVNVIVADTFLNCWAVEVGNRRGIPVASFWPMSAIAFGVFYHYHLIKGNGHHYPFKDPRRQDILEEIIDYIPGISSIRVADLPLSSQDNFNDFVLPLFPYLKTAQYLLCPSVFELEPQVFRSMRQEFPFPMLSVGPLIPYFNVASPAARTQDDHDYYNWLDNQTPGSVLYVSMGSFLSRSDNEVDEIAAGLNDSRVSYFWVARNDALRRKEISSDSGLIVPWCDQLQVLLHPSIGGFWTHCGWSSTIEAIFSGVVMLTSPIAMDQFPNSKMIVDDWKIGTRVVEQSKGFSITRGHVAKVVKEFMDPMREERKEMSRNIKEMQKLCRQATERDGSSAANIGAFLSGIGVWTQKGCSLSCP